MNTVNRILYKNAIEWEQKRSVQQGDSFLLNDSIIQEYQFKEDYYFVTGDKVMNSKTLLGIVTQKVYCGKSDIDMEVR